MQTMTADSLTERHRALWDVWLDKYVNRLITDVADVTDVTNADNTRRCVMNSTNPRYQHFYFISLICSYSLLRPIGEAEYCDEHVRLSLSLSVCVCLSTIIWDDGSCSCYVY